MWHLSCNREVWGLTAWELTFYFIIVWYVCYAIEETRVKADILLSHRDIARRMSVSLLFLLLRNSNTHNLTIIKCFRTSLLFPLRILVFLRYLIQWELGGKNFLNQCRFAIKSPCKFIFHLRIRFDSAFWRWSAVDLRLWYKVTFPCKIALIFHILPSFQQCFPKVKQSQFATSIQSRISNLKQSWCATSRRHHISLWNSSYFHVSNFSPSVSATNFLLPKINNIVDIWQYSNYYRFPHCRLRTILSKIGNAHTFLLPFSALPITNNIVENRKRASMFHCRNTEISSVAENYKLSHVLTYIIMFLVKK